MNKKGALELSVGTIVIIVIAMAMLILGLVFVRTIFSGATDSVDVINDNVRAEIDKLFSDNDKKVVVNLPDGQVDIKKGNSFGIVFAVRNTAEAESTAGKFNFKVLAASIEKGCQLTITQADSYVKLNSEGSFDLLPGVEPETRIVKIEPTESAPLCEIVYEVQVKKDGQPYDSEQFIVNIVAR